MRRPVVPLLLPAPTRLARLDRARARLVLALAVLALLLVWARADAPPDLAPQLALDAALVDSLRHGGEPYYAAAAPNLQAGGMAPAALPQPAIPLFAALGIVPAAAALALLIGGIVLAWSDRLPPIGGRVRPVAPLVAIGVAAVLRDGMVAVPQLWAGLLVALALGRWRPDRWIEAAGLGLAAMVADAAALPFLLVMLAASVRERRRREAIGWAAAAAVGVGVVLLHLAAARAVADPAEAGPWLAAGPWTALAALAGLTGLAVLPVAIGAATVALAAAGWLVWRDPVAPRAAGTLVLVILVAAVRPAGDALGLLVAAPVLLLGLVPAAEAARELIAAALDRRRITVTRVMR